MAEFTISQVTVLRVERTRAKHSAWTSIFVTCADGSVHEVTLFSAHDQPISIAEAEHERNVKERTQEDWSREFSAGDRRKAPE